jgi:hypothetical protein
MKVLDLQCPDLHVFEGWFASEADFISQLERGLVTCPVCGHAKLSKKLSAPRLNLGAAPPATSHPDQQVASPEPSLQAVWMAVAKSIVANTEDVGTEFAEEARKMHYGESQVRGIRGHASADETAALQDEGIEVMPFMLPQALKQTLQ